MTTAEAKHSRLVVVGPPRAGTTLLASLLAELGVEFGLEKRGWNINSGYYEHPDLLRIYGQVRKYNRVSQLSDNLGDRFKRAAIRGLADLLSKVEAIKYPPISAQLPYLMAEAGYAPVLAVSARLFEPYAISRMRMEGVGYDTCKHDYLEIYRTALVLLRVYQGSVVVYEGLRGPQREPALRTLASLAGASPELVEQVVTAQVGEARSRAEGATIDQECRAVYEELVRPAGAC